jgi:hypothetical protein
VLLACVVLAATAGGFLALRRAFDEGRNLGDEITRPLPANGAIVVSRVGAQGRMQLFVAQPDGSGTLVLTETGSFDDLSPAVSPDGTTVAFQRRIYGEGFVIASVPITGGDVTELTERALPLEPAWSPDGSQIAFAGSPGGGPFGLWVMDADGSNPKRIAGSDDLDVLSPTWSPDGSRIAFVGFEHGAGTIEDIFSVTPQGDGLTRLTDTPGTRELSPGWSPDGRTIAFVRSGGDVEGSEIWTIRPDGSDPVLVERSDFSMLDQLAWAPDGTALLATFEGWVHQVDLEKGGFVRLVEGASAAWQPIPAGSEPTPSPVEEPTESSEPAGRDIGLGVAMCDLEVLHGIDWDGTGIDGAAWTGAPVDEDGRCSSSADVQHVVAVDRDGDGIAEQGSTSTLRSCLLCRPFDTMDLDDDGVLELVVLEEASSTPTYSLYEVNRPGSERALGVYPIFVAPPGAPAMNLDANEPTRFMVGGDEGFSGSIACENDGPGPPILRYTWVRGAVDTDTELRVDVTRLSFGEDGVFHIESVDRFSVPRNPEPTDLKSTEPACGVDFHPAA